MSDFDARIKEIFEEGKARSNRLGKLLENKDDLVSLVLRGHLVLEELLFSAAAAHCPEPEHLKAARLRFPQLVQLVRALEKIQAVPESYWDALLNFNTLRNQLAHQLEPQGLEQHIARFVGAIARSSEHSFPAPHSSREALEAALYFLIGGLDVVATWHAGLEALIYERATASESNGPKA